MDQESLNVYMNKLRILRTQLAHDNMAGLSPEAEEYVALALDALSTARHHLQLAVYRQMKKQ